MDNMNRKDLNGQNSVVCEHVIITAWVIAIINTNLSNSLSFVIGGLDFVQVSFSIMHVCVDYVV